MKTITTPDNFTWHIVDASEAQSFHQSNIEVYQIYDDLSEALVDEGHVFDTNNTYGIEPSNLKFTKMKKTTNDMDKINSLIETMTALVEEGVLTGLAMEHILYKVRAKTENDSFFATWHDNHLHKK